MSVTSTRPSIEGYRTVSHPEEFYLDWRTFYESAYDRGQALRARKRHSPAVAYGADPAKVMNIFYPDGVAADAPVFVFMHGGAFQEGHPDHYDFAGESLIERGAIFVSMGYRLAPVRFPESAKDVAQGLAALDARLRSEGSQPARYCLSGHSAGAAIAALLSVRPDMVEAAAFRHALIDSTVLLSGIYDFRPPEISQNFVAPELREDASPVLHCQRAARDTVLVYGFPEVNVKVNEPGSFRTRAIRFAEALRAQGHHATLVELADTNHMETACSLQRPDVLKVVCRTLRLPDAPASGGNEACA